MPNSRQKTSAPAKGRGAGRKFAKGKRLASCSAPIPLGTANFGKVPALTHSNLHSIYMGRGGGTGSVTTKNELGIQVVDFFTYNVNDSEAGNIPQSVTNYFWEVDQNLFNNAPNTVGGMDSTFCRVRKLEVYIMPPKGWYTGSETSGPNNTNTDAMLTVQCQVPASSTGIGSSGTTETAFGLNTQVTNVLPQFQPRWKKILGCDLQKTFQSGVARPWFFHSAQCLFQMQILNPATGLVYLPGAQDENDYGFQVKVVMHIDQPIAIMQEAKLAVHRNEDFSAPAGNTDGKPYSAPDTSYVQMNLSRVNDYAR